MNDAERSTTLAALSSPQGRKRGRVLRATFGCNPNSSSLGVDVTFLLFGATFASAIALVLGALLRKPRPSANPVKPDTMKPLA